MNNPEFNADYERVYNKVKAIVEPNAAYSWFADTGYVLAVHKHAINDDIIRACKDKGFNLMSIDTDDTRLLTEWVYRTPESPSAGETV
jgi:hypothetical protein